MTREEEAIQILEKYIEKHNDPQTRNTDEFWAVKEGIKALRFKEGVCEQLKTNEPRANPTTTGNGLYERKERLTGYINYATSPHKGTTTDLT